MDQSQIYLEQCHEKSYNELKEVVRSLGIPGISKLRTKDSMCAAIIQYYTSKGNVPTFEPKQEKEETEETTTNEYTEQELNTTSYKDLRSIMRDLGIPNYSKITYKDDMINAIINFQKSQGNSQGNSQNSIQTATGQTPKQTPIQQAESITSKLSQEGQEQLKDINLSTATGQQISNLLSHLSFDDLTLICEDNIPLPPICNDDNLWENLYNVDYPSNPVPDENITWRVRYLTATKFLYDSMSLIIEQYSRVNTKYVKTNSMLTDSTNSLKDFIMEYSKSGYNNDILNELSSDLLPLVTGVIPEVAETYFTDYIPQLQNQLSSLLETFGLVNLEQPGQYQEQPSYQEGLEQYGAEEDQQQLEEYGQGPDEEQSEEYDQPNYQPNYQEELEGYQQSADQEGFEGFEQPEEDGEQYNQYNQ